jgi:hypothetical protein
MLNASTALRFVAAALVVVASACTVPASVDGTVLDAEFTIRDEAPELRPQGDGAQLIVLADDAGGVLRLVKLRVADLEALPIDETVEVASDGDVTLEAALGTMESFVRSDGVRVVSATDATFVAATSGTLTLASRSPLAGEFEVELEDGGSLFGSFVFDDANPP